MDTARLVGALVSAGLRASQPPPEGVVTAELAKKRAFVAERAATVSILGAGRGPPVRNVNDSLSSESTKVTATTASPTASRSVVLEKAEMRSEIVIAPRYIPGLKPAGFTVTLRVAGVTAVVGSTRSQLVAAGVAREAAALKANAGPAILSTGIC